MMKAITADQLGDDEEYVEILEDMRDECSKFGIFFQTCLAFVKNLLHVCVWMCVFCKAEIFDVLLSKVVKSTFRFHYD